MNIRYEKDQNRIAKLEDLLEKCVIELKNNEDEILGLKLSLYSARMFNTALMLATQTASVEFTREELKDITENKMIGFSEVKNEAGEVVGVKLEVTLEEIANETKEMADTETSGKRTRKSRQGKVDRSEDTVQTGIDSLNGASTDERLN
jgi:hypothetical protein